MTATTTAMKTGRRSGTCPLCPALTTIKQPLYDMGAVAMRMLTKLMNNEEVDETHIELPYELVKKQSTLNQ